MYADWQINPHLAEKLTTSQLKSLKGRLTSQKFKTMTYMKNEEKPYKLICLARRRSSTAYEKIAGIQEQMAM